MNVQFSTMSRPNIEVRLNEGKDSIVLLNVVDISLDTPAASSFFASFRRVDEQR